MSKGVPSCQTQESHNLRYVALKQTLLFISPHDFRRIISTRVVQDDQELVVIFCHKSSYEYILHYQGVDFEHTVQSFYTRFLYLFLDLHLTTLHSNLDMSN